MRYHRDVFFPETAQQDLEAFTVSINGKAWRPSAHCLENLKHRTVDLEALLSFIVSARLYSKDIFEYYTIPSGHIEKACYRVQYGVYDIILVISDEKNIITIYLNSREDKHETLKKELYCRP